MWKVEEASQETKEKGSEKVEEPPVLDSLSNLEVCLEGQVEKEGEYFGQRNYLTTATNL